MMIMVNIREMFKRSLRGITNKKTRVSLAVALPLALSLVSCASDEPSDSGSSQTTAPTTTSGSNNVSTTRTITEVTERGTAEGGQQTGANNEDKLDLSAFPSTLVVTFSATGASIEGSVAGVAVETTGADVVIRSTAVGVNYILRGSSNTGSLKLYSNDKYLITLDNLVLGNNDGAALNLQSGAAAFVYLPNGSESTLSDASSYATINEDAKGTVFAEGKLLLSGLGKLNVKGLYKHGIASDDYVRLSSGTVHINSTGKDGIHTNDAFYMDGGTLSIDAVSDAVEVEKGHVIVNDGVLTLKAGGDGIAASYDVDTTYDAFVTLNGGTYTITSEEGIESKSTLTINGGTYVVNTTDDGFNASKAIYINGGKLYIKSTTNDAVDSNGTLTITGGHTVAIGARTPEASFDSDRNTFKITGGTIVGIAGSSSTPTASVSTQNSLLSSSLGVSGQLLHIASAGGEEVLTFLVPESYSRLLFSSPKLKSNTVYTIYSGGSVVGGSDFSGLYLTGTYSGGTATGRSFTTNSRVTSL